MYEAASHETKQRLEDLIEEMLGIYGEDTTRTIIEILLGQKCSQKCRAKISELLEATS